MGSEWTEYSLADLGRIVTGKTPSKREDGNFGDEVPFVTPRDLDGSRNIETTERYLSEQGANTVRNSIIPPNSIAVSCIGSDMGKAAIVKKRSVTNQQINSIILDGDFDYHYVYYVLSTRKQEIRDAAGGSAQPILNKSHFSQLPILIPPLPEQKSIAHILGTLDDKIELNRRMNATLEGMAQALFKSWFVDFDPVIDNALAAGNPIPDELAPRAEVRKNALANGTTQQGSLDHPTLSDPKSLFPAAFEFTEELSWIPEGWETLNWGSIAELNYGKSIKGYRDSDGSIPVFGTNGPIGCADTAMFEGEGVIIGRKGAYRGVHYSPTDFSVIDTAFYLVPQIPLSMKWAFYELLRFDINGMDSGSAIPSTSREDFYSLQSVVPPTGLQQRFDGFVASLYAKKDWAFGQCDQLTKLRDTLLPKLISGSIEIPLPSRVTRQLQDAD